MADFDLAFEKTSINEGYYSNREADRGGETYRGISRKKHPDWAGWKILDLYKNDTNFPDILKRIRELNDLVPPFYKADFWDQMQCDAINNQCLATKIFDLGVNLGCSRIIKIVQRLLYLVIDGIVGSKTLAAINAQEPAKLLADIKTEVKKYYESLNEPENINGWLARLERD